MLCRKDVNTLLGEMDAEQATLDYQSIAPEIFDLLSTRLAVSRTILLVLMQLMPVCHVTQHTHLDALPTQAPLAQKGKRAPTMPPLECQHAIRRWFHRP